MFKLLYADDTLLLTEWAGDVQKAALDATVRYCEMNRTSVNLAIYDTPIEGITINDAPIERVDSFCYLGIVFRHNNTFQNAIKHNIDKARKAVFEISVLLNEVNLDVKTRIHFFDTLIIYIV